MKRLTTIISGTGKYEICQDVNGFWAIEHEYIGADGRLIRPINGIQGGLMDTYEQAVKTAMFRGKVNEYAGINNPNENELLVYMSQIV